MLNSKPFDMPQPPQPDVDREAPVLVGKGGNFSDKRETSSSEIYRGHLQPNVLPTSCWSIREAEDTAHSLVNRLLAAQKRGGEGLLSVSVTAKTALGGMASNAMRDIAAAHGCAMELTFPNPKTQEMMVTMRMKEGR